MTSLNPGFAIYVHWPFCRSKCPYCDFNSIAAGAVDQARWRKALLRELGHFAGETRGRAVTSVFFGGGTPSLMDPATLDALISAAQAHWPVAADLEVTLEANPTTAEAGRFADFAAAGVNRLSLGVQSLDDGELAFLGRTHDAAQARAALALAERFFPRYSFDLIYGLPGQTAATWRQRLEQAAGAAGEHLSLYQLSVEPGTPFHKAGVQEADADTGAALFEVTGEVLDGAGLNAYEVSNHARGGGQCRHNLTYWRGGDYVGIGPGAHGRLSSAAGTEAVRQVADPRTWLEAVETEGHGTGERSRLERGQRRDELLLMGLRLGEGVNRARFRHLFGDELIDAIDADALGRLIDGGFLVLDAESLRATPPGRACLNTVLAALLI
jgi:putative oxygen-independent coproporphyrinogen III oxidase